MFSRLFWSPSTSDMLTTSQARAHGNEPSKGAKIDKQLEDEEAEILKKKGAFGPK